MLIGYICRKVGVFGENTGKMISGIVINIGNPALIIASGMNPETLENKAALLVTLAVALIFFAIMFVIAELIPRLLRADRGLWFLSGHDDLRQYWLYGLSSAGCHVRR